MNKRIILIDLSYLCHRARYTTGGLQHKGEATGVAFGVIREIDALKNRFEPDYFVFACDGGSSKRKEIYPEYKANREDLTPEERMMLDDFHEEVRVLRDEILPMAGFSNIFQAQGYEGDDIIARVSADEAVKRNKVVIVSSDHDLYQCIRDGVAMYHPTKKEMMNVIRFVDEYRITPQRWHTVKAIAGCPTDNVQGVKGVGEATAVKYLREELKPESKKFKDIEASEPMIQRNSLIVKLPFAGCPHFELKEDEWSESKWIAVKERIGIRPQRRSPRQKGFL